MIRKLTRLICVVIPLVHWQFAPAQVPALPEDDPIYLVAEVMPRILLTETEPVKPRPGEPKADASHELLLRYLGIDSVRRQFNRKEKLFLSFVVDTTGRMTLPVVQVDKNPLDGYADRVIEMLQNAPSLWTPALQKGKKVRCKMLMPF
jgi:hypothetical protein